MADLETIRFEPENRGLVIPVKEDDFARFIAGLLGRPQTLRNRKRIRFEIGRKEIENCFYLVNQRINQQDNGSLVQFTVTIMYDDGSSVLLESLDAFVVYKEVKDILSIGATLSWTYLIKFRDSPIPEKQRIDLSLYARTGGEESFFDMANPFVGPVISAINRTEHNVFLRIQHTARTWGADLENLIVGEIMRWDIKTSSIEKFVKKHAGKLSFGIMAIFFSFLCLWLANSLSPIEHQYELVAVMAKNGDITEKLNLLIDKSVNDTVSNAQVKATAIGITFFIACIILSVYLSSLLERPAKSHLLLSDKAEKRLEKDQKDRKWSMRYFIGSAISSTVAGVLSKFFVSLIIR